MTERIDTAYGYLKSKGYSDFAVSGILGNLTNESGDGLNTRAVHDGGTGIGIAGWRDPTPGRGRKTDLINYANSSGRDVYDLKTQLDFLDHELQTKERGVYNRLQDAKSPSEAALAFISFERPQGWTPQNPAGGHNWSGRNKTAGDIFSRLTGAPAVTLPDVGSTRVTGRVGLPDEALGINRPLTDVQRNEMSWTAQNAHNDALGFGGALWEAGKDASPITWALQGREEYKPNPDFLWKNSRPLWNEVTKGVPEQFHGAFTNAQSEAEAWGTRKRIDAQLDISRRIEAGGWSAKAGAFLGEMLEPVGLASSFIVPEIALPAKMGRLGRIVGAGLTAAGTNAALEVPRYVSKETAQGSDLVIAAGAGLVLGGTFGALRRNPVMNAEADQLVAIGKSLREMGEADAAGMGGSVGAMKSAVPSRLTDNLDAFGNVLQDARPESWHDRLVSTADFSSVGQLRKSASDVARVIADRVGLNAIGNVDKSMAVEIAATEFARVNHRRMSTQMATEWQAVLASHLEDVPVGQRGAAQGALRREVWAATTNRNVARDEEFSPAAKRMAAKLKELYGRYQDLASDPGQLSGKRLEALPGWEKLEANEFYTPRVRDDAKVVEAIATHGNDQLAKAYADGIVDASGSAIAPALARKFADGYLSRIQKAAAQFDTKLDKAVSGQDLGKMRELLEDFGNLSKAEMDTIIGHFEGKAAKKEGNSPRSKHRAVFDDHFEVKMKDGTTFRLGDLFIDDAVELFEQYSRHMSGLLGLHQVRVKNPRFGPDNVRPMERAKLEIIGDQMNPVVRNEHAEFTLRETGGALHVAGYKLEPTSTPAERQQAFDAVADYAGSRGLELHSPAKVGADLAALFRGVGDGFTAKSVQARLRTMAGAKVPETKDGSPVYRVTGEWSPPSKVEEYLVKGLSDEASWAKFDKELAASYDDLVMGGKLNHEQRVNGLQLDRANLQFLRDQIMGNVPDSDKTAFGKNLRRLRDFNYLRVMGNVGFAQVTEFFNVVSTFGLKASLEGIPAFRSLVRDARTGQLSDEVARDLEWVTAYGTDVVRGKIGGVVDEANGARMLQSNGIGRVLDETLEKGKRLTSNISLMNPINTGLQRFAIKAAYAKFVRLADGVDAPSVARMRVLGVGEEMQERIFKSIRASRSVVDNDMGTGQLPRLNLDKWIDREAAANFQMSLNRWAEYAVLNNDPGAMHRVIGSTLGKVILQFRSFVMGSWGRHLLHNIHMKDAQTAYTFLLTGLGGVLTHVAYSHLRFATDPKREDKLDKALSLEGMLAGGFQRTSWSSFLPMVADSALDSFGDPVFGYRMSDQPSNAIWGNPTAGLYDSASKGLSSVVSAVRSDNDFTQKDARNVAKVFPWGNWLPFVHVMNIGIRGLPDHEPTKAAKEKPVRLF